MGLVSKTYTFSAGAVIVAAQHNTDFDTLYNLVNGTLDTNNLASNAGILATQLNLATVAQSVTFSGAALVQATSVLSDGATPALNAALGNIFTLSAAGNRTIAVPTNGVTGQKIIIAHTASGGARTLSLNTGAGGFAFGSDITSISQTASGKTDYIGAIYNGTSWNVVAFIKGF